MKRYVIERDLPGIGSLNRAQLKDAAAASNAALAKLAGKAQWLQSFVKAPIESLAPCIADFFSSIDPNEACHFVPAGSTGLVDDAEI